MSCSENFLPEEIWCSIFSNLQYEDLISLSLVCRAFYQIIANSTNLMDNFQIALNKKKGFRQFLDESPRKYQNLRFINANFNKWTLDSAFLDMLGMRIRHLVLEKIICPEDKLISILNAVSESLESLEINSISVKFPTKKKNASNTNDSMQKQTIEWKNLKFFGANNLDSRLIKLFSSKTIEKFVYSFDNLENLRLISMDFVNQLSHLNCLDLDLLDFELPIFSHDFLKILKIQASCLDLDDLAKTINQLKSLEELVVSAERCRFFYDFKKICLTLKSFKYYSPTRLASDDAEHLLDGFPNLEELVLQYRTYVRCQSIVPVISIFIQSLRKLEISTYMFRDAKGVSMPTVVEIKICDNKLEKCDALYDVKWRRCEYECGSSCLYGLFKVCPNLEKFVTDRTTIICEKYFEAILNNSRNLRTLVIENGSGLSANIIERNQQRLSTLEVFELYQFTQDIEKSKTVLDKYRDLKSYITHKEY